MKIFPNGCVGCQQEQYIFHERLPITEDRSYAFECGCGQSTIYYHGHEKFELLFEAGLQALTEGFLREAILDFTGCLERTYESIIRIILAARGVSDETIAAMWKQVAPSSERQFGMFHGLWALEFGMPAEKFPQKQTELRNDVVHKGIFCDDADVIAYGQAIWEYWAAHWGPVAEKYHERIAELRQQREEEFRATLPAEKFFASVQITQHMSSLIPVHRIPINVENVIGQKRAAPGAHTYAMITQRT